MLISFSVAPSGVGELSGADPSGSVSAAVVEAVRIVRESGLPNRTDSMFTTVEGDWDECMDVVKRACEAAGRYGSRVSLVLKADIRPGHTGELAGKVSRVEAGLQADATAGGVGSGGVGSGGAGTDGTKSDPAGSDPAKSDPAGS